MSHPSQILGIPATAARRLSARSGYLFAIALVVLIAAVALRSSIAGVGLLVTGLTLAMLAALLRALGTRHDRNSRALLESVAQVCERDGAAGFATDRDGQITYRNAAARERFQDREGDTLVAVLGDMFASPASVLYRLQRTAEADGAAREDVVLRRGVLRLSSQTLGDDGFLWRFDDLGERASAGRTGESAGLPMMTVSRTGTILFMNEAMRRLLGGRETNLDRVFTSLPVAHGDVVRVNGADGAANVMVCELASSAGRRELYLMPEPPAPKVDAAEWGVVDGLPVPLMKLDSDGVVAMANASARTLLGGDDDLVGKPMSALVEGVGRPVSEWLREAMAGRNQSASEVGRAVLPDDEVFLQIGLSLVSDADGPALVVVMQDATALKSLEAQFVQSQKMQAIGQLAGGVAHDFNNLLTAISGHCDLLLLRHQESDSDYADLDQIRQNANRAAALVGQLLAFSRKQTLRPEIVDLTDTLGDLGHLLNRLMGERTKVALNHGHDILPIRADKRQLEQVLMNLVVNARDAMPEGGNIKVETRNTILADPLKRDRATVPPGDYVTISVSDEGVGIPADRLSKIFEPFFTTKGAGKGTGLGLSMAYGIVKQTGGFIFVDSVVGSGSTFTLYFPVSDESEHPGAAQTAPAPEATAPVATAPTDPAYDSAANAEPDEAPGEIAMSAGLAQDRTPLQAKAPIEETQEVAPANIEQPGEDELPITENDVAAAVLQALDAGEDAAHAEVRDAPDGADDDDPQAYQSAQAPLPTPTHDLSHQDQGIVLLVEDEAPVRAFAARALRLRGYTVLEADSAEAALKTLAETDFEVDVFVTDVVMPGMDGPTWVAEALKGRPGVKVVFVSGYAEDSVAEHQARIPNSVFLPKPFSLSELTATVQQQLH